MKELVILLSSAPVSGASPLRSSLQLSDEETGTGRSRNWPQVTQWSGWDLNPSTVQSFLTSQLVRTGLDLHCNFSCSPIYPLGAE